MMPIFCLVIKRWGVPELRQEHRTFAYDQYLFTNKIGNLQFVLLFIMISIACISIAACCFSLFRAGYELLILLPLSFGLFLFLVRSRIKLIPKNLAVTFIIGIEFVRLVIVPLLFVVGGYPATIVYNAEKNNIYGILLQVYEVFWIAYAIQKKSRVREGDTHFKSFNNSYCHKKMAFLVLIILGITIAICYIAPEIFQNYRLITSAKEKEFTNLEQSYIVNMYASSTTKKFFLIIANYILKPVRLIVPAFFIVYIFRTTNRKKWSKFLSLIIVFTPFLFVDGTVARSLYFTLVLFLLYNSIYRSNLKKIYWAIGAAAIFIITYWIVRYNSQEQSYSIVYYFGEKFNDYFSGFNIVGAVESLPQKINYRLKYFLHDYLRTVPFSNTLFGLNSADTVRTFFNICTHAPNGQIPATLAMGCYYFTPLFSPLYSYLFTRTSINSSERAARINNPYYQLIWNITALYFALGIGLNDVSVTLSNYIQVILPVYLIIRFAFPKERRYMKHDNKGYSLLLVWRQGKTSRSS